MIHLKLSLSLYLKIILIIFAEDICQEMVVNINKLPNAISLISFKVYTPQYDNTAVELRVN